MKPPPTCEPAFSGQRRPVARRAAAAVAFSLLIAAGCSSESTRRNDANSSDVAGSAVDDQVGTVDAEDPPDTDDGQDTVDSSGSGDTGSTAITGDGADTSEEAPVREDAGPVTSTLRRSADNPRYFFDDDGPVYLTGSHTWTVLQERGRTDPPAPFDYDRYLDFLTDHGHNFFRMWAWEQAKWSPGRDYEFWLSPVPYARTGSGTALDGKPRFDLSEFNDNYFERLRDRVAAANERGIYVAIMLFNGWSIEPKGLDGGNPWDGHPFNAANNVNGIDGDPDDYGEGADTHTLAIPEVTAFQEAYVRHVVDTVNEFDNVLYEISNESWADSIAWQNHMVGVIKSYEATLPKQHPVGITVAFPGGSNEAIVDTDADWISPNGDLEFPGLDSDGKIVLLDTDHLCGICGSTDWVWTTFTNGMNPIFMDPYSDETQSPSGDPNDPTWVQIRENLGYAAGYAARMDLVNATPRGDLSSSGYALAKATAEDAEYLVFTTSERVDVDLSATDGTLTAEWLSVETGEIERGPDVRGGGNVEFRSPFSNGSVLYLSQ